MDKRAFIKCGLLGFTGCMISQRMEGAVDVASGNRKIIDNEPVNPKHIRDAMHAVPTARGPKCMVCPHECTPKEGEKGDCRNRMVKDGKMITIGYGNPCAVHIDPVEKKPFFHYIPGSTAYSIAVAGCNLACLNCQNWEISQSSPDQTRNYDLMPEVVVEEAIKNGCKSIAYTYSEPITFFEYVYDTAKLARKKGIKNLLVTAGFIHETPLRELSKVIDGVTLDVKSFSNEIYEKLNAGNLDTILNTIKVLKEENVWVEISNLVVTSWSDNEEMILKLCEWLVKNGFSDNPLHFLRFMPLYKLKHLPPTPADLLEKIRLAALKTGVKHVYVGNVPGTDSIDTFCYKCSKLLVDRKGFQVGSNQIKNGNCSFCGEKIPGVWN